MADIVLSVASKVAEYLVFPVGRQFGYVIFSESYVGRLKEELENLEDARDEVQPSVDYAQNNMKEIKRKVNRWKNDAETEAKKARDVLENHGRAKKTCFCGWLPNPKERYCLGRDARKTAQAIKELIPRSKFDGVCHKSGPPGHVPVAPDVNSSTGDGNDSIQEHIARGQYEKVDFKNVNSSAGDGGDTITDSRASIFQGIMKALDDQKLKVIGVYGPGGVGKTTLLEEVKKKLQKETRLFNMIVKVEVSHIPDLNNIQGQIADALGLSLEDKKSPQGRRDHLLKRLQNDSNEKILIILDDLRSELNLKAVGIPSGDASSKCKLLLTSRFKDVLEHDMCADKSFRLQGLNNDEAFKLFEKHVGDGLKDNQELEGIAAQMVKKLAGLPLLIISVAKSLKKNSSAFAWKRALKKIDKEKIETIVKLSYDHLGSEDTKSLFLLCGLIGGTIQVDILLGLGMGLGLFEGFDDTIEESRDTLNYMLDELRSVCLLQDGGDDKGNVTIHDLYSEVVVSNAFSGQHSLIFNSNYGSWSKEKLEKCWAICLPDVGSARLVKLMLCRFPDLKILMLSQPVDVVWHPPVDGLGDCSRLDFTCMKELQVLYLCSMHITGLHSSINILGNLRSLYLDRCRVEDVAILGKLKALRILSFAGSRISRLPKEIGELMNLQSLNLSDCRKLRIIEPGALKCLINLEELHMKDSFDRWMGKDQISSESRNARISELKSLTKITSLEISVPHPTILLEEGDLPFGNLVRFWINIGYCESGEFEGLRTMKLKLKGCDSILSEKWVQKTLQKTQYLHLDGLRESRKNAHELNELCTQGFGQLKHLDILNSPSIKYIANSSYGQPVTAFKILESLFLKNLINLEKICNCPIATECFSQLKVVCIEKCHRLKNLWFLSEMLSLVHLEEIRICECDSLQAIITDDAGNVEVAVDYIELPNVRRLDLRELPNMASFCTGAEGAPIQVSLPRLESLVMVGLLGLEEILFSEPSFKYGNLKSLKIEKSKSTSKSILKLDWILKMPNLESLEVEISPSAEVVFDIDDSPSLKYIANSSDGLPLIPFTKLESLHLDNLINLEKIYHGPIAPECFSKLKAVIIKQCNRVKYLWCLSDMQRFVQLEEIEVWSCHSMQSIVAHGVGEDIVSADCRVELPKVRHLALGLLPNMTSFCTRAEITSEDTPIQVSFPRLESLELWVVGLLNLEKILYGQPPLEYSNLKSIVIKESRSKSSFFKSDWILKLPNLETLHIAISPSAEAVFDLGELKVTRDVEILSRLMKLKIWESPNLLCIWKQDVKLQGISVFRSLKQLEVGNTGLAFLFPVSVAKCLREIRDIQVAKCPNMKAVIVDEEGRDEGTYDIIEFPLLESLHMSHCPADKFFSYPHGKKESITTTSDSQDAYSDSFFDPMVSLPSLKRLYFNKVGSFKRIWHGDLPRSSFCELATLTLTNCSELLNVFFPSTIIGRLHNLNSVKVENCPSLESLFDCGSLDANTEQTSVLLPKLEEVRVRKAGKLRSLVKSDSQMSLGFPSLKDVEVGNCSGMKYLFPHFTATTLEKLERIDIGQCEQMKEVVREEEGGRSKVDVMSFPSLRHLHIWQCPNFGAFIRSPTSVKRQVDEMAEENDESPQPLFNAMVTFPNIRSLKIEGLQCKELWNNQIPTYSFWKLESLELKTCANLQHIAPSHMWKRLQHCLEILEVISCCSIKIIYEGDGTDTESGKLRMLVLRDLENLRHIWQSDGLPNIPFPYLRDIEAVRCSRLEMLFATFTAKFLGQIKELVVESCGDMELIAGHEKWVEATGTTITISRLTVLRLFDLPKFRGFLPEKYSLKFPDSEDFPSLRHLSIVSCGAEPDRGLVDWEIYHRQRQMIWLQEQQMIRHHERWARWNRW